MAERKRGELTDPYIFPATESEAQRLERQGSLLYGGPSFLDPFLARGPGAVLDVGCGSGFFSRVVAEALPSAEVIGLDRDPSAVDLARGRAAADRPAPGAADHSADRSPETGGRLCFEIGDMRALPYPSATFDLVFSRFALVHCPDPTAALREMARVTKPGGEVVAYDMVHDGIWLVPDRPAFAAVVRAVVDLLREQGAEPDQGLYLASGMRRAGLNDVGARVIAHQALAPDDPYPAYRDNWIATLIHLRSGLDDRLEEGILDAALEELARTTGEELLIETTVLAWGRVGPGR